jgi:hypothetical protein
MTASSLTKRTKTGRASRAAKKQLPAARSKPTLHFSQRLKAELRKFRYDPMLIDQARINSFVNAVEKEKEFFQES